MIAFESYVGAIIREHPNRVTHTTPDIVRRRVETPFLHLKSLFAGNKLDWQSALKEILPESPLVYREWLMNEYLFNKFISPNAMQILAATIAVEKDASPQNYLEELRAERLKPPPVGRLDRWKVPKPMARMIRGLLYAVGKDLS